MPRAASFYWLAEVKETLASAERPDQRLAELVRVAIPEQPDRQAVWRVWLELRTYAGRDAGFRRTTIEMGKYWHRLIEQVLEEAETAGLPLPSHRLCDSGKHLRAPREWAWR